jgi:valyl-tRNA synthetase
MTELSKTYDPKTVEDKWYAWWMEKGYFHGDASKGGQPHCIVIPPPNVTGVLHMGHALNNSIQDVLTRWRRMQGYNAVWVPGTDHAGIATQNVVERALQKEGITRDDLGREAFVERVWAWREQYGNTIKNQLKKLGASCDWERERFTMDEGLSRAVTEVFVRLYEKNLIYRGNYIINWCPRCQTALSDEESEHRPVDGKLYHIRYAIKGGRKKDYIIVATTRPETLLGDTAVAVNPRDERYRTMIGKQVILPVLNREIPVIEDDFVDPEFGTGIVKVTPAHDPNDFDMGQRHDLPSINVMDEDGYMNAEAGPYAGMDRFQCREALVDDLKKAGVLEKVAPHQHAVGHCYRCDAVVEPRLSPQWFVKMKPLARPALEVVQDGRIQFVPERWSKVYQEWMENIRDWCISRQIWWGHRIPVYYCDACDHAWAAREKPSTCPSCASAQIRQDEDVLDTWFSSWLWPFSVFGWPDTNEDLKFYYPTSTLSTASEIIFFWVARMVMAGLECIGDIPFDKVYIHGTVRADDGRKMSKSLGNSIDPLDVIEKYSADALRFSLLMITATGTDVYLSDDKFEIGRNFGTKIWNAARFMQMNGGGDAPEGFDQPSFEPGSLSSDDQHIIARLHSTIASCTDNLERLRFNDVARDLYEFLWHQYCDWYLEYSKPVLNGEDAAAKERVLRVMHYVYSNALRLLHPMMPFITEELWQGMGYNRVADSIMIAAWPEVREPEELEEWGVKSQIVSYVDAKHDLIRVARQLRADYNLTPRQVIELIIRPSSERYEKRLGEDQASIAAMLNAGRITLDRAFTPPNALPSAISQLGAIYMPVDGLIDAEEEVRKLTGQLDKVKDDLQRVMRKLDNMDFINKAPREVVQQQEERKKDLLERAEKLTKLIETLNDCSTATPGEEG